MTSPTTIRVNGSQYAAFPRRREREEGGEKFWLN
jgi:hypothetical protein